MLLYRLLTELGAPALALVLRYRRAWGREDEGRFQERLGLPSLERPLGPLIWCHAASVGEAMSVLSLITALRVHHPTTTVLVTTGTVTSARLLASRLPSGVLHQYIPVDRWSYITRFLDHWRPDLVLWVESELWPNFLTALRERKIPAVLINGRMSEKSFQRWSLVKLWIRNLLGTFTLGFAQTEKERERFKALGLADVRCCGNLKYAATPLPWDAHELEALKNLIGNRKFWLMASTHEGEEDITFHVHKTLGKTWPDILTLLVPRHPVRAAAIKALGTRQGLKIAQRSHGEAITPDTNVYLADTMGEMGLFYRLANVVGLGGSFTWGGHNPIEPAQLDCAIVFGPRMTNFSEIARDMVDSKSAIQVSTPEALSNAVAHLLDSPSDAISLAHAAKSMMDSRQGVLDEVLTTLDIFNLLGEKTP